MYLTGILWNIGNEFAREIILKIDKMQEVIQVSIYELKDQYDLFVLDCYKGDNRAFKDGYIYEKIKHMKATTNTKVVVFKVKIQNPTYNLNEKDGTKQCVETREIKQKIREEYASKVEGYFFDNLIHITDNEEELQRLKNVLEKYKKYIKEDYTLKEYKVVIGYDTV